MVEHDGHRDTDSILLTGPNKLRMFSTCSYRDRRPLKRHLRPPTSGPHYHHLTVLYPSIRRRSRRRSPPHLHFSPSSSRSHRRHSSEGPYRSSQYGQPLGVCRALKPTTGSPRGALEAWPAAMFSECTHLLVGEGHVCQSTTSFTDLLQDASRFLAQSQSRISFLQPNPDSANDPSRKPSDRPRGRHGAPSRFPASRSYLQRPTIGNPYQATTSQLSQFPFATRGDPAAAPLFYSATDEFREEDDEVEREREVGD